MLLTCWYASNMSCLSLLVEFILIIVLITCPLDVAIDGGIYLLIKSLSIPENVTNLLGWCDRALISADTGGNQVTDADILPDLVLC